MKSSFRTLLASATFICSALSSRAGGQAPTTAKEIAKPAQSNPAVLAPLPAVQNPAVQSPAPSPQAGGTPAQQSVLPSIDSVRVTSVTEFSQSNNASRDSAAGIGDIIAVYVHGLENLLARSKCRTASGTEIVPCTKAPIVLFLDGREMAGLNPESGAPQKESQMLQFHLQRATESDEAWADLLGGPRPFTRNFFGRPTAVSVGLAGGYAVATNVTVDGGRSSFTLIRFRQGRYWACMIGVVFLLIGSWYLAKHTELLRDIGERNVERDQVTGAPKLDANDREILLRNPDGTPILKPYSLARWQMAVWFVLVVGAFLYIWISTGATDTITTTVLALMGIGAGTALGAAAIDSGSGNGAANRLAAAQAEQATLSADIATIRATASWETSAELSQQNTAKSLRLKDVEKESLRLQAAQGPQQSRGWIYDLLADDTGGYSFHRFQMFVWTFVLVLLFLHSVWARLSMPEFSGTLLALMGVSGGTYLGFKIPEKAS